MQHWTPITVDDLAQVFDARELETLQDAAHEACVSDILADAVAVVREAIANNPSNTLDADTTTIPRTLRGTALDLIAIRLLKRFALVVTDERRQAADQAQAKLDAIARAEFRVISPDGTIPVPDYMRPEIVAPSPAYGNDGGTWYPTPNA